MVEVSSCRTFLSLCKGLNDLVYRSAIMITYWAESVAIKRSKKSVTAHRLLVALSLSQTHSCVVTHSKSHKMDLHFSVVTLQQIKSLVKQDFLAVTVQTSLNKQA